MLEEPNASSREAIGLDYIGRVIDSPCGITGLTTSSYTPISYAIDNEV